MPVSPCLPMHITVLYIVTVTNLTLLLNLALVDANVFVSGRENQTRREFYDLPAGFGPSFPDGGLVGFTIGSEPVNGCTTITPPPSSLEPPFVWIAVIQRSGCPFDKKVINAQKAGYGAVIVYNMNGSSSLIPMGGDPFNKVLIPSCFVGYGDGRLLVQIFNHTSGFIVTVDNDIPFDGAYYLFPLAVVLGICFILMLIFMIVKWLRDVHKKRKSRLSKKQLSKIPTKKFKKGDDHDVCAVCLDDYEENQELRVLPCSHVYHIKCIDPWLLQNKPTCPICKRKVVNSLPDPEDPEESDSDADEDTPLIRAGGSGRPRVFGATNTRTGGEPSTINYQDVTDDSDTDLSDYDDTPHVMTHNAMPGNELVPEVQIIQKSGLPDTNTHKGEADVAPTTGGDHQPVKPETTRDKVAPSGGEHQPISMEDDEVTATDAEVTTEETAKLEPSTSAQLEPSTSAQMEPSTSTQMEPSTSTQMEPSTSAQMGPSTSQALATESAASEEPASPVLLTDGATSGPPVAPLEPTVVVESGGRHSINTESREFDGVV